MLKCCINNYGDFVGEVLIYDLKEKVRHNSIGLLGELVVLDPKGVDVAFFDLIVAYDRHP